jgi:hypothetical protein
MSTYTFTATQLYSLLTSTVDLYVEHVEVHGQEPEAAKHNTAIGTQDGLDEAQWLIRQGELEPNTGQIYPGTVCPACLADYEQSGVENL